MARTKREQSPIGAYHVLLRSAENLFPSDGDRAEFEQLCRKYFTSGKRLYSLAMTNDRIHLVFADGGESPSAVIKPITTSYARYYNRTYKRTGKLFADRYKSRAAADTAELADFVIYVDSTYGASVLRDKTDFFETVCPRAEYERRVSGRLEKVCLDAFDAFSNDDILNTICRMCGISRAELDGMSERDRRAAVRSASVCRWVSVRRMCEAAGIEGTVSAARPQSAKHSEPYAAAAVTQSDTAVEKPSETQTEKEDDRRNLSVWLL